MNKNIPMIAYTVITKRGDGKLMFLVEETDSEHTFPSATYEESCTALASVINVIKKSLNVDVTQLELSELINTVIDEKRIPLYVFNYEETVESLDDLITAKKVLSWQVSDHFTDTLNKYEISGVPHFD